MKPRLVVLGSINMGLVVRTSRFPKPGETLLGGPFVTFPGGKGANQAVAAARLGADVRMLGAVGAFACSLARAHPIELALERACAAGALACTRRGALPSLPGAAELDSFLGGAHRATPR